MIRFLAVHVGCRTLAYAALVSVPLLGWAWLSDAERRVEVTQLNQLEYTQKAGTDAGDDAGNDAVGIDGRFEFAGPSFLASICDGFVIRGFDRLTELRFESLDAFEVQQLDRFSHLDKVVARNCDSQFILGMNRYLSASGFELESVSRTEVGWQKTSTADR